jgi:hypothetical protein
VHKGTAPAVTAGVTNCCSSQVRAEFKSKGPDVRHACANWPLGSVAAGDSGGGLSGDSVASSFPCMMMESRAVSTFACRDKAADKRHCSKIVRPNAVAAHCKYAHPTPVICSA